MELKALPEKPMAVWRALNMPFSIIDTSKRKKISERLKMFKQPTVKIHRALHSTLRTCLSSISECRSRSRSYLEGHVFGGGIYLPCLSLRQGVLKRSTELITLLRVSGPVTKAEGVLVAEEPQDSTHHAMGMRGCEQGTFVLGNSAGPRGRVWSQLRSTRGSWWDLTCTVQKL